MAMATIEFCDGTIIERCVGHVHESLRRSLAARLACVEAADRGETEAWVTIEGGARTHLTFDDE